MLLLSIFLGGFTLGIGAAVPLGPINLLIMNEALQNYKKAVAIGFGAMSADITYFVLLLYGITNYLNNDYVLDSLSLFGGLFLIYLAILIFRGRNKDILQTSSQQNTTILSSYLKGYTLTLVNPYTVLFWLSITSYSITTQSLIITMLGMIFAIMLWVIIMPYIIFKQRSLISNKVASIITIFSSFIIFIFGLSLVFKLFI